MYQGLQSISVHSRSLPDRTWPNNRIEKRRPGAPSISATAIRRLVTPDEPSGKARFLLAAGGYRLREIEVGSSASETEYEILRALIDGHYIPDDVTIQVLVQARAPDPQNLRGRRREKRHHPLLTTPPRPSSARSSSKEGHAGIIDIAVAGAAGARATGGRSIRHEFPLRIFSGILFRHGNGFCRGYLPSGDGNARRDEGKPGHPQPAQHG